MTNSRMAAVRSKDTKPEIRLRKMLFAMGYRYRLHVRSLPGKPDIVLPRFRTAIFVNGCFWHRHPGCPRATFPSVHSYFWSAKFSATVARDAKNIELLQTSGWRVITVWECELQNEGELRQRLSLFLACRLAGLELRQGQRDKHQ